MKILIDFDPITQEISSVEVDGAIKTPKTKKSTTSKTKINEELQLTLESNKIILSPKLVELLQVKEGDRLIVRYKEDNGFIQPFLAPAKIFTEEGGNKLTKSLSVSFRGDQQISLARFGTIFEIEDMKDGSVKLLSNTKITEPISKPLSQESLDILSVIGEDNELTQTHFIIK